MKSQLQILILGILTGLIVWSFTNPYTAALSGVVVTLGLMAWFIARVWIKELRVLFSGTNHVYDTITIWKGFHRPFPWFVFHPFIIKGNSFYTHKAIRFTKDSMYDNDEGKYSINKLFGFTTGHPHKNSWRWGWSVNRDGEVLLHTYSYQNGVRITDVTIPVQLNKTYHLFISYRNGNIVYKCNDVVHNELAKIPKYGIGWKLGTYFGGKLKAPKTIKLLTM